jgi:hypothetical protein
MNNNKLERFGFSFKRGGAHSSRTMMLEELRELLAYIDNPEAGRVDYLTAIDEENCLGKRSGKTRILTYRHLVDLYSLDPSIILYRALLFFWQREPAGRPLLALLCTYARDPIFRSTASFILKFPQGSTITRVALEAFIDDKEPGRFSQATLKSTAQNINSTWTKSGHLEGRVRKIRVQTAATAGSVAYGLLLGYLTGARGESLFTIEYTELLDCSFEKKIEFAEDASSRGWIVFKRIGEVMEVQFPNLMRDQEMEWIHEQN